MLRRALCVFLVCTLAWLPLVSVAGLACGGEVEQTNVHDHHAPPGKAPDQTHHVHVCHSVCASCALLSTSFPVLLFSAARQFSSNIAAKVPRLDLPVQERPPRLV